MTPKPYTPVIGNPRQLCLALALSLILLWPIPKAEAQPEIGLNGHFALPLGGMANDVAYGGGFLLGAGKRLFIRHSLAVRTGVSFYDLEDQTTDIGNFSHEKTGRLRVIPLTLNYTYAFRDEMAAGKLVPTVGFDVGAAFLRSHTDITAYNAAGVELDSAAVRNGDYDVAAVLAPQVGLEYWLSQAWALRLNVRADMIFAGNTDPDPVDFRYEIDGLGKPAVGLGIALGVKWAIWGSHGESFYEYKDHVKERRMQRKNKGELDNDEPLEMVEP